MIHHCINVLNTIHFMGSLSLLQGMFPTQGIELRSLALQADSLPAEPQGKPKNTGVGSLSLLQGDLPDPGIEPESLALQEDSLLSYEGGLIEYFYHRKYQINVIKYIFWIQLQKREKKKR